MRNDILEQAQEIRTSIDNVTGTMEDADAAKISAELNITSAFS